MSISRYVERHSIWYVVEIRRDEWMRWSKKFDSSVELRLMSGLRTEGGPEKRPGGVGDPNVEKTGGLKMLWPVFVSVSNA